MGIRAIPSKAPLPSAAQPLVEPKATCAACGRPIALLKATACVYCGTPNPDAVASTEPRSELPAELLIALEPRTDKIAGRMKWVRRGIAFAASSLIVSAFVGACMKR